jgi:hypothetical protein
VDRETHQMRWLLGVSLFCSIGAIGSTSFGKPPAPPTVSPRADRWWGIGAAVGGGVSYSAIVARADSGVRIIDSSTVRPVAQFPTIEAQFFYRREYSVDLSLPLINNIVGSVLSKGLLWSFDTFFNANVGSGMARLVIGPGLGFAAYATGGLGAAAVRFPGQVGVELLTPKRWFGFKLLARPWVEVAGGSAADATGTGLTTGVMGVVTFASYHLR